MNETMPAPAAAALATARAQLATIGGCAVLIGVEDYSTYDRGEGSSTDDRKGSKSLHAGRNDVLAYWKVCRRLGYKADHIRVRTSPILTKEQLIEAEVELALERYPGKTRRDVADIVEKDLSATPWNDVLGDATLAAIIEAVRWLGKSLVYSVRLEWETWSFARDLAAFPGFFAYSGHGAQVEGDLALCPSDVRWNDARKVLENAVSFKDLRAMLEEADAEKRATGPAPDERLHPTDNLTVVLDCCFAAAGQESSTLRVSTLTPTGAQPLRRVDTEIGSRVFCASGRDEHAYQAMMGGHWHGAFTWAFTRALEQWKTAPSGAYRKSTISHVELLFRARMLLEALSFPQHPVFVDRIGNLPVFHHDSDVQGVVETSPEPTAERRGIQMDPGNKGFRYYAYYTDDPTTPIATVLVPKIDGTLNGVKYHAGKEHWFDVTETTPAGSLTVTWADHDYGGTDLPTPGTLSFTMEQAAGWYSDGTGPGAMKQRFVDPSGSIVVLWGLGRRSDGTWTGNLVWNNTTGKSDIFRGEMPAGGVTFTANKQPNGNVKWYWAVVPATQPG